MWICCSNRIEHIENRINLLLFGKYRSLFGRLSHTHTPFLTASYIYLERFNELIDSLRVFLLPLLNYLSSDIFKIACIFLHKMFHFLFQIHCTIEIKRFYMNIHFSFVFQIPMMAETPAHAHIKQEIDTTCCSPSPSNGNFTAQGFIFNNNPSANSVRFGFFFYGALNC